MKKDLTHNVTDEKDVIRFVPRIEDSKGGTRGVLDTASNKLNSVALVASDKLAENFQLFAEKFGKALSSIANATGKYHLDEVKVSIELGVEGEVTLVGAGASASGGATLELVFKRADK